MIINRYLSREIALTLAAVTALLLLMFLSSTFVRTLAGAAHGEYSSGSVMTIFGLQALVSFVLILPLSFFAAVLLGLGRLYKDSEMTAMGACGIGPARVLRVVFVFSLAVGAVVALFSLYITPWAEGQYRDVLAKAGASAQIEGITAGRFNQAAHGEHLLYVESMSDDRRTLKNVFVHSVQNGETVTLSAAGGYQVRDPESGERYLVLVDGYRYDGTPGRPDYKIIRFETHTVRIEQPEARPTGRRRQSTPTAELWASSDPQMIGELQRRISLALSTVLLGLLAVPLSKSNPRQGRYGRFFIGIMIYIVYTNLLTVAEDWVGKGKISPLVGMWWVHALVVVWVIAHTGLQSGFFRRVFTGARPA